MRRSDAAGRNLTAPPSPLVVERPIPEADGDQERQPARYSLQLQERMARISTVVLSHLETTGQLNQLGAGLADNCLKPFETHLLRSWCNTVPLVAIDYTASLHNRDWIAPDVLLFAFCFRFSLLMSMSCSR